MLTIITDFSGFVNINLSIEWKKQKKIDMRSHKRADYRIFHTNMVLQQDQIKHKNGCFPQNSGSIHFTCALFNSSDYLFYRLDSRFSIFLMGSIIEPTLISWLIAATK